MKIFLSHNSRDKSIVTPIAQSLSNIFGQDNVFFDSWSIQPGDNILDKMEEGLVNTDVFFFFMSKNSLASDMVKLEWQNTLFKKAQQHRVKLVPVLIDSVEVPFLLSQTLFIDILHNGLETGLKQMIDVIQGNNNYVPMTTSVKNLRQHVVRNQNILAIEIYANFFMEPNSQFLIFLPEKNIKYEILGESMYESNVWDKSSAPVKVPIDNNFFVHYLRIERSITVGYSLKINISLSKEFSTKEILYYLYHRLNEKTWEPVPIM